jgi:dienelactone hydrolase
LIRSRLIFYGLVLFAISIPVSVNGQVYNYTTDIRGTRMWVPPGLPTVMGVLIYGNGAGADERDAAYAPWLQQFAQVHNFALIATSMWGNLAGSEINTWDAHLAALASASGHPELKNAPWAPIGFSNGGQMSYGFNAVRPEKTIAFITNKGCCYNDTLPPAASLKTPGILIAGELDTAVRRDSIRTLFDNNRARGAFWSWVEQQGVAHAGLAHELMLPFMDEAIRARYPANQAPTATAGVTLLDVNPTNGWLADQSTWHSGLTKVASYDLYPGNKQTAGWLLDKNAAFLYRAFSTYDHDAQLAFAQPQYPGLPEINFGFSTASLKLQLNLSGTPGWTKIELFNDAQSLLQLTPDGIPQSLLNLDVPIPSSGVYGLSALVTHADGQTLSTTNLLVYTAVPEPSALLMSWIAAAVATLSMRSTGRRNFGSATN